MVLPSVGERFPLSPNGSHHSETMVFRTGDILRVPWKETIVPQCFVASCHCAVVCDMPGIVDNQMGFASNKEGILGTAVDTEGCCCSLEHCYI